MTDIKILLSIKIVEFLMGNDLQVNKANRFIEARYKLTLLEQKFILMVVSLINPEDIDFKYYSLSIKEVAGFLGLNNKNAYRDLRKVIISLNKKTLIIPKEEKGELIVSWVASSEYFNSEGRIEFEFSDKLKPYLLQLKRDFTSFKLRNIIRLKSSYSIRIYELLKQYEKIGMRKMSLVELRKNLGLEEEEYPHFTNFNQKVLKVAEAELREKTDISFTVETIKEGRAVVQLLFHIKHENNRLNKIEFKETSKEPKAETININIESIFYELSQKTNSSHVQRNVLLDISTKEWDYVEEKHRETLKNADITFSEYVLIKAEYVIRQYEKNKANNPIGLLIDAIKNNYEGIESFLEVKKQERNKTIKNKIDDLENAKEKIRNDINQSNIEICREIVEKNKEVLIDIIKDMKSSKLTVIRSHLNSEDPYHVYNNSLIVRANINSTIMEKYSDYFARVNEERIKEIERINREIEEARKEYE